MKRWFPLWAIPCLIVLSVATVGLRLSIVKTTYTIGQTEKVIANLKQGREHTSLKLAGLRSPRRLEGLSKTKFNLEQPRADQVVYLK